MRCVLIGSKQLSVNMLRSLVAHGANVAAVFSRDSEAGMRVWHRELGHESLAEVAYSLGITVHEGLKVNSKESKTILKDAAIDIIFSCFWGEILDEEVLTIPRLGAFNLHTAYLPKYRGSRPIPWAIINGEPYCGLTIHQMATGVDNGPIVDQVKVEIQPNDSCKTVYDRVIEAGSNLFDQALPKFINESYKLAIQDEGQATYYPRGEPLGGQLMPHWDEEEKSQLKRAYDFPPFASVLPPPNNIGTDPAVYWLNDLERVSSLNASLNDDLNLALFEKSKEYRKKVRPALKAFANKGLHADVSSSALKFSYKLLDALRSAGIAYIITQPVHGAAPIQSLQPFRHVNGVLEIPCLDSANREALESISAAAERLVVESKRDVFIGLKESVELKTLYKHTLSFNAIASRFNQRD